MSVYVDKVIATKTKVTIENKSAVIVKPNIAKVDITKAFKVIASPRTFYVSSQDTFVIRRNADLPGWYLDQLENAIDSSALAEDVSDLETKFGNFEDGVTRDIGLLTQEDTKLAYDINTIKVSNDTNTAGIQHLNETKVTANEARAVSETTIAAWQSGVGGAWFDEQVSVVSNVAYSAAKSASTLTASIDSQQDQLNSIVGDIDTLQSQVDGKVETWSGQQVVNNVDGTIIETEEPYATWLSINDVARHTGDTYLLTETGADGKENLLSTFRFVGEGEPAVYRWAIFNDDLASKAYQEALDSGILADSKIVTFYQTFATDNVDSSVGDLWIDSDNDNKIYRYDGASWIEASDGRIEASVNIISEAIVTLDGQARAKYGVTVGAGNSVGGFLLDANNSTSTFKVFADKFVVTNTSGSDLAPPFSIDNNRVRFNGVVSFDNVDGSGDFLTPSDIDGSRTTINGNAIYTGTINADKITANSLWVDGSVESSNFSLNSGVKGFRLDATGYTRPGSNGWNIIGGNIYGGNIRGSLIEGGRIIGAEILLRNKAGKLAYPAFKSGIRQLGYHKNHFNFNVTDFELDVFAYDATGEHLNRLNSNKLIGEVVSSKPELILEYAAEEFYGDDFASGILIEQVFIGGRLVHTSSPLPVSGERERYQEFNKSVFKYNSVAISLTGRIDALWVNPNCPILSGDGKIVVRLLAGASEKYLDRALGFYNSRPPGYAYDGNIEVMYTGSDVKVIVVNQMVTVS